ncbi:MAG TPA: CHAT domain-containing protein [Pyrinomonadaceae bacterium]|nr:CHAT domain-containing protein [Pyrinomonadaceae bacterium]
MRTITLELLRHGPAHNQLLSPLTTYLALCENHPAVTVRVPFEHNQFLHRLNALGYRSGGEDARIFQLQDTARTVGDILGQVPGLTAELSKVIGAEDMAHLRLIISASELALLPFELALSPQGFPGSGQHLLLQPQTPICLTRETRRTPGESVQWPLRPRILFVAAAPGSVGTIPLESHLLALRRAIGPWVRFFDEGDDAARAGRVAEHLKLLTGASVEAIERECSSGNYTHIHILAHGVEVAEGFDRRFYLALHDAREPEKADYISGPRLATALRVAQADARGGLSMPTVVTLASCDSGNVGTVAGAGSSIAHALHEAGIPVVIAGQFPLSFEGSVRLVEILYEGLLWGADPRRLLHDLRRRLFSQFPNTHDWASLMAYMSLPPGFDERLPDIQAKRSLDSLEAATSHADEVARRLFQRLTDEAPGAEVPADGEEVESALLQSAVEKILAGKKRLERLLKFNPSERSEIYGLIASSEKRHAEIVFSSAMGPRVSPSEREQRIAESAGLLLRARDHYWQAFAHKRSNAWVVTQHLSLALVIKRSEKFSDYPADDTQGRVEKNMDLLWSLSYLLSSYDIQSHGRALPLETAGRPMTAEDCQRQLAALAIWAHGNLLELNLLSLLMAGHHNRPEPDKAAELAHEHADSIIELAGRDSFEVSSTRRQIFRYLEWYRRISDIEPLVEVAQRIFRKFSPVSG